jgi:hypothetical protein
VIGRSATEHRTPPRPQTREVEIAQARDLGFHGIMTSDGASHGRQAARRAAFLAAGLGACGGRMR